MQPLNNHMPGYRIQEYQLVLNPHEELRNRVSKIREVFAEKYRSAGSRSVKSYIPLVRFTTLEMMEERIIQRLQAIAMGFMPFKVEMKDYGSYPSHSIFINVISKLPIQNLVKELRSAQRLMKLNQENKPHFMDEPHLAIAANLKPWQYEQGWMEYSNKQFTGRFIADGMLLLKREAGSRGAYQISRRFEFQNLPVATKQGNLFV